MKKSAQRDANTVCWLQQGRAENFRPVADPLPGDAGRPKFNQLEMVTTFTYKPSLVRFDACNFELSWQQTHKHTHRQDRLLYTAPPQLARSVITTGNG